MSEIDLCGASWRKSTRSSGDGACVEVATLHSATAVRDSKDPAGPALIFIPTQWAAFTAGIRAGEFT
jgi:predicted secreted Zn-dependent protease